MNDIIALKFHISLNATTWIGRIGMVVLPPIVYFITYRWASACSAATVGPRARRRDRHHQAAAAGRLHRTAPAAGPGRRARPPDGAGVPGCAGAQAHEQARLGGAPGTGSLLRADPPAEQRRSPRPHTRPNSARSPRCASDQERRTATARTERPPLTAERNGTGDKAGHGSAPTSAGAAPAPTTESPASPGDDPGDPAGPCEAVVVTANR